MEERGFGTIQVLGPGVGIERPAAEGHHPAAAIGDRKDDALAEAVVRGSAVLRPDEQARLHQLSGPGALGDQIVLELGALGRRIAQAEALPVLFLEPPALQIGPRVAPARPAQLAFEPARGRRQPVLQPLALLVLLGPARIQRR